jgi:predicted transcriptional regulator
MVAQWLHAYLGTLGNHDVAVIATGFCSINQLEVVYASSGTIPAAQLSSETGTPCAHNVWISTRCLPTVTTITRSAEGLVVAAMVRCKRAESAWELSFNGVPTTWEIPIGIAVRRVRDVVVLANKS